MSIFQFLNIYNMPKVVINPNFREKVRLALNNLQNEQEDKSIQIVANKSNLIVATDITVAQDYNLNVKATAPNQVVTDGQIYLQQQDIFIVESIAYYWRATFSSTVDKTFYFMCDTNYPYGVGGQTQYLYEGVIAYQQQRTVVSDLLSMSEFNKRKAPNSTATATAGVPVVTSTEFDLEECSAELMPYWVLSGARDNFVQLKYAKPFVLAQMPSALKVFVNMRGVIIPNVAPTLSIIENKGKSLFSNY